MTSLVKREFKDTISDLFWSKRGLGLLSPLVHQTGISIIYWQIQNAGVLNLKRFLLRYFKLIIIIQILAFLDHGSVRMW